MILNAHSYYSLRYGTLSPEALCTMAADKGHEVVALTDINNSTGILEFVKAAEEKGITALAGMEFRTENRLQFIAIAQNNQGFQEINALLTHKNLNHEPIPDRPHLEHCHIIYPLALAGQTKLKDNEWIGVCPNDVNKLQLSETSIKNKSVILHREFTCLIIFLKDAHNCSSVFS